MAKDRKKLLHIHSSIADKQPTPATLEVGEIAVNNAANQEFLSIRNSEDKVKRFSSDEQMITWMERKEVMPYKGYVKGRTANSTYGENPGAGDAYNSYGITNDDLLENKSQIIIKLNQVAAKNTGKYDKVNAATDKYGNTINPWSGETIGDGAGFYIDMSRYAMNGANPSFSSLTVTDKTDLSGNTTIANGDGTGTRTGHTLTIKTTDVVATNTNWTETITNHTSKVTTEKESATTRTTVVGTENLTVSGTTTEQHTGNVTITNSANVTATTNGNEVELIKGNNYRDVNGNYSGTTSGTTTEVKTGAVNETNSDTTTITRVKAVTETDKAARTLNVSGASTTNVSGNVVSNTTGTTTETKIGNVTENHSGTTTENKNGIVTENNLSDKTENTTGVLTENNSSNHILNTTGTTDITRTGIVTEDNKNNVVRTTSGTTTETFKGQVTENNQSGYTINTTGNVIENTTGTTTITRTGVVSETNNSNVTINNKASKSETTDVDLTELVNGNNYRDVNGNYSGTTGGTTTEVKTGAVNETNSSTTTIDRVGDVSVNNQSNVTEVTSGNTIINHKGTTNYNYTGGTTLSGSTLASTTTGNTSIHADGAIGITAVGDIIAVSSESDIYITANDDLSATAGDIAAFKGVNKTNIGIDTEGDEDSVVTNIYGETINTRAKTADTTSVSSYTNASTATTVIGTADTQVTSANTIILTANTNAITATLSGNTLEIKEATSLTYSGGSLTTTTNGNTTINVSGETTIDGVKSVTIQATDATNGDINIYAKDALTETGKTVTITGSSSLTEKAPTITVSGGTLNQTTTGNTTITTKGADKKLTLKTEGSGSTIVINADGIGSDLDIDAADDITIDAGDSTTITSTGNTKIQSTGDGADVMIYAKDKVDITGVTVNITGTTNISGETTIDDNLKVTGTTNISGETTIDDNLKVTGTLNVTGNTTLAATTATTISASTSLTTPLVSATTVSADTLYTKNGLEKSISWSYGSVTNGTSGSYNGKSAESFVIPKTISDVAQGKVSSDASGNLTTNGHITTIASQYEYQTDDTSYGINMQNSDLVGVNSIYISDYSEGWSKGLEFPRSDFSAENRAWDSLYAQDGTFYLKANNGASNANLNLDGNLVVGGTITATGAIYSSDINLKENVQNVDYPTYVNANGVAIRKFNFKNDESKRTVYGVIAQEVEIAGLEDIVVVKEDGFKGVDYTALSLLKIAYLENKVKELEAMIKKLTEEK